MRIHTKAFLDKTKRILQPHKGIILFLLLFFAFEFMWKVFVRFGEGDNERIMLVAGKDLTYCTDGICSFTAKTTYWLVHDVLNFSTFHRNGITLYFENSIPTDVIWGCIGLKQAIIFCSILIFYYGPWKKKLMYIPFSLIVIFIFNILRQAIISIIIKDPFPEWFIPFNEWQTGIPWENTYKDYIRLYTAWFEIFHRDIFTWIYYDGVLLFLWFFWEEKFNKPYQKSRMRKV